MTHRPRRLAGRLGCTSVKPIQHVLPTSFQQHPQRFLRAAQPSQWTNIESGGDPSARSNAFHPALTPNTLGVWGGCLGWGELGALPLQVLTGWAVVWCASLFASRWLTMSQVAAPFMLASVVGSFLIGTTLPAAAKKIVHPLITCFLLSDASAVVLATVYQSNWQTTLGAFLTRGVGAFGIVVPNVSVSFVKCFFLWCYLFLFISVLCV